MTDNDNLRKLLGAELNKIVDKEKEVRTAEERQEEEADAQGKRRLLPIVKAFDALQEELKGVGGIEIRGLNDHWPEVRLGIECVYISMLDREFSVKAGSETTYYESPEEVIQVVLDIIGNYIARTR
ncbi:MAG: hypothetical protein V7746_12720 [Halioglobus sp.]